MALVMAAASPTEAGAVSDFYGTWRIARIAGFGEISSGRVAAKRALGRTVSITADSIVLPDDPCIGHPLSHEVVQVDEFLRENWQVSRSDLNLDAFKLAKTATHIGADCADALVLDGNHLLVSSGAGTYYIIRRKQ